MNLYSIQFVLFLLIVFICYYTVCKEKQWICLLAANMVFYFWTGSVNMIFILVTSVSTWFGSRYFQKCTDDYKKIKKNADISAEEKKRQKKIFDRRKQIFFWGVILLNFGILGYLKYWKVLTGNTVGLLLPLGISFYTFQSIGYLIDTYNGKYESEGNFFKYLTFVSFFPQLIQGPINRYDAMGSQISAKHEFEVERTKRALLLIEFGTLKKYVIANLTAEMVSLLLDKPERNYPGCMIVFGILLYSLQQYADFSGGIDMVLGVAKLFGIEMKPNFRQPYFATSLADFWRRWHMSLGNWMRDYVFYPFALTKPIKNLGKWANKKCGKHIGRVLPAALGNILVFFLVGLWHGAQWNYILWGLYNGIVIAISDFLAPVYTWLNVKLHINTESKMFHLLRIVRTFLIVNIGWYFDRIESMDNLRRYVRNTLFYFELHRFNPIRVSVFVNIQPRTFKLVLAAGILVLINSILCENNKDVYELIHRRNVVIRWGIYILMIGLILMSFTCTNIPGGFMYANF